MTETVAPIIPAEQAPVGPELPQAYTEQLNQLSVTLPEVAEKREAIESASAEIISQCGIQPSLFENPARSVVFTGIASRWAENTQQTGDEARREHGFLMDTLTLLAYEHSDMLGAFTSELEDKPMPVDRKLAVYDKYTDPRLSAEITQAIDSGLLDDVKQRMGITADNEDPYEVRVLSIDSNGDTAYGLSAPDYQMPVDVTPENRDEWLKDFQEQQLVHKQVQDYKEGLEQRAKTFAAELGGELFAPGWVTRVGDKTLLCITMPLAEKILDKSLTEHSTMYDDDEHARDIAFLKHEYVHTQGRLDVDKHGVLGINLEERRAEHFSGDKHGYTDVKSLLKDVKIASGLDVLDMYDKRPKGGSAEEVYADVAQQIGLANMVELLVAAPRNYLTKQGNRFLSHAMETLGDYDGVVGRILEANVAAGKQAEIEDRIDQRAKGLIKVFGTDVEKHVWYESYIKGVGLTVVPNLVGARVRELIKEQAA